MEFEEFAKVSVEFYNEKYREAFRSLNLAWIEKYFKVETKDLEQLDDPETCVRDGGQIFFVVQDGAAVATCALYFIAPNCYELAKMAVADGHRGRGFGDLLMATMENWARNQRAKEILILSNTLLEPAISLYLKHGYKIIHQGPHPDYERANIELKKAIDLAAKFPKE